MRVVLSNNMFSADRKVALLSFSIWMLIAFLHLFATHLDTVRHQPNLNLTFTDIAYFVLAYTSWSLLCFFIYKFLRSAKSLRGLISTTGLAVLIALIWLPIYFVYDRVVYSILYSVSLPPVINIVSGTPKGLYFLYGILVFCSFAVCSSALYSQRSRQSAMQAMVLKQEKTESELAASRQRLQILQSQLSPHFMFNCLSAVSALARSKDKKRLLSSISQIGSLLRYSVAASNSHKVLLSEELAFIKDYIALQSLRFDAAFEFEQHIDENCKLRFVIPFCLQPLIENTFVHGVAKSSTPIKITLDIEEFSKSLLITVKNTLPETQNQTQDNTESMGSGLKNLEARLALAYPNKFSIDLVDSEQIFTVEMCFPIVEREHEIRNDDH